MLRETKIVHKLTRNQTLPDCPWDFQVSSPCSQPRQGRADNPRCHARPRYGSPWHCIRFSSGGVPDYSVPRPGLEVERSVRPTRLELNTTAVEDHDAHPVTVNLYHMQPTEAKSVTDGLYRSNLFKDDEADADPKFSELAGKVETVEAKYVIGCDGARSWIRK
jgi:flavin-dependent dehydrogenase